MRQSRCQILRECTSVEYVYSRTSSACPSSRAFGSTLDRRRQYMSLGKHCLLAFSSCSVSACLWKSALTNILLRQARRLRQLDGMKRSPFGVNRGCCYSFYNACTTAQSTRMIDSLYRFLCYAVMRIALYTAISEGDVEQRRYRLYCTRKEKLNGCGAKLQFAGMRSTRCPPDSDALDSQHPQSAFGAASFI